LSVKQNSMDYCFVAKRCEDGHRMRQHWVVKQCKKSPIYCVLLPLPSSSRTTQVCDDFLLYNATHDYKHPVESPSQVLTNRLCCVLVYTPSSSCQRKIIHPNANSGETKASSPLLHIIKMLFCFAILFYFTSSIELMIAQTISVSQSDSELPETAKLMPNQPSLSWILMVTFAILAYLSVDWQISLFFPT